MWKQRPKRKSKNQTASATADATPDDRDNFKQSVIEHVRLYQFFKCVAFSKINIIVKFITIKGKMQKMYI